MFFDIYKQLCTEKGKTPNGVAKELGFASPSVTQWKHGATPRPVALKKFADYFGVSVNYLLGYEQKEDEKKPPAQGEELSERDIRLVKWFRSLPPEKQKAILVAQDGPTDAAD